ncbi:phospholipid/cholesterol/gamma-HCH transport system substrate-binding protein [Thermomonospora echinospora]|uniref:Phospholipid/cholesterol/gamma-HCH transport system substrate-binding protein n=1 Tax=Thermomonospora echinospora TaxID=1992 RepID=A0A1H5VM60_9ACTN|nr:MCE family protein [Thermomonospora echinospora]SEF88425.1 phospholipid/cholesterol/gamma-HCH transport system substrate-binding protein [Thermomonospora echinospora]
MRRTLALGLVAGVLASGCSVRTLGAPKGDLTLVATFDDTQQLVTGHSVQMSDVKVGSVTGVRLVAGYKAEVTMSIRDEYRIPQGTSAEIKVTSLLGENFVDLRLPPGQNMSTGPFLRSGDRIAKTSTQPSFEQVVGRAGPLVNALAGDDLSKIVNAGASALGGNGPKLNAAVAKSAELLEMFAGQRAQLTTAVDEFARLGRSLARGSADLGRAPAELERTTRMLNQNAEEILATVEKLTRTARLLGDRVLEGRVLTLKRLIQQVDPVLEMLAGDRQRLGNLVDGIEVFTRELPRATYDGQLLLYPLLRFVLDDGTILPRPTDGSPTTLGGRRNQASDPVPGKVRDAMPNLDDILERPR